MRIVILVLVAGCGVHNGSETGDVFAADCIRSIGAVRGMLIVHDSCGGVGHVRNVTWDGHALVSDSSFGGYQVHYDRVRLVDSHNDTPIFLGRIVDQTAFLSWKIAQHALAETQQVAFSFEDITSADLDGNGHPEIVLASDNAIRAGSSAMYPGVGAAQTLLLNKPFASIAVAQLGLQRAADLFYVASSAVAPHGTTGAVELGIALQTSVAPLTYQIVETVNDDLAPVLPLVVGDVDGDRIPDVVGAAARIFVRSSAHQAISFLPERARAIAVGDIDGDGIQEPIYLAEDGNSVRRVEISADGSLGAELVLQAHGEALAVGDLDGNGIDDIVLADKLGEADSSVRLYRR